MPSQSNFEYLRFRLGRDSGAAKAWFIQRWRAGGWFRVGAIGLAVLFVLIILAWAMLVRGLPDAESLLDYETPLPTMVRGGDGEIVHSFAREHRVQLQYGDFPTTLIEAFLAAEDRTFFSHGGVDITGTLNAVVDYVSKLGSGERAIGGSTITQQVAKNLLLGNEYSVTRKLKEMILARRIEDVLTKQEILTLYLNEIALGRRSFGVQAASRAYFGKDVWDLDLHQMAFLAILPKAPERYGRSRYKDLAVERRNFVLDQMVENGFVTVEEAAKAKALPLGLVKQQSERLIDAGFFFEAVRRQLIDQYGETAEDGPNSVYAGGLWVRTSLDVELQYAARDALQAGLMAYHGNRGWHGPVAWIDPEKGDLVAQLDSSNLGVNFRNWRIGVIVSRSGGGAKIGFSDGKIYPLIGYPDALKLGDVVAAEKLPGGYGLRSLPGVSGGFLVADPKTGRILAMQGGFDSRLGDFNRATQALRQPGSTVKPFVYATGLEAGMTPATLVPDDTFCYYQGSELGEKCFRNFGGNSGGVHTMRWGLEQSRNLMTVHIAMDAGMRNVVNTMKRLGIGDYKPYPSFALGAGETTVERMVSAYSTLVNHGRQIAPTVIDYIQDRDGKVIWRADKRRCTGCNMPEWDGKPMPRLGARGKQLMDPRTAYQVVHMLRGVVTRGTAVRLRSLGLPLIGKTGTTNGPTNAWFMGGSPDMIGGVYVGYDQPRNLGGWVQGSNTALPVFKQFVVATRDRWHDQPIVAPSGIRMVKIDRRTGKRVFEGVPSDGPKAEVIWEAFKPDTVPPRQTQLDRIAAKRKQILDLIRRGQMAEKAAALGQGRDDVPNDFVEQQGGIY